MSQNIYVLPVLEHKYFDINQTNVLQFLHVKHRKEGKDLNIGKQFAISLITLKDGYHKKTYHWTSSETNARPFHWEN